MDVGRKSILFEKTRLEKYSTGSSGFDRLLGGGLPVSSITDIFGGAGTGKTQFAFQNAVMNCEPTATRDASPRVIFVDCANSFRPERIFQIAESRSLDAERILGQIYSVSARDVKEQVKACNQLYSDAFSSCKLVIIDDITANFMVNYKEDEVALRQSALAVYMRDLAYFAQRNGVSILLTNSARSRGENVEGETTGEVIAQFSLNRLRFMRKDRIRSAELLQPELHAPTISFEIGTSGIA